MPPFVLLPFSDGTRQVFSIHFSKVKIQLSLGRYLKTLIIYRKPGVNVVGRDPSEKRNNLFLLLGLFQHPLEII